MSFGPFFTNGVAECCSIKYVFSEALNDVFVLKPQVEKISLFKTSTGEQIFVKDLNLIGAMLSCDSSVKAEVETFYFQSLQPDSNFILKPVNCLHTVRELGAISSNLAALWRRESMESVTGRGAGQSGDTDHLRLERCLDSILGRHVLPFQVSLRTFIRTLT